MARGLSLTEEFSTRLNSLKNAARNDPKNVPVLYKNSRAFRDALDAFHSFLARTDFERRVFSKKVSVPRAPGFASAWNEYDTKWRFRVAWTQAPGEVEVTIVDWDDPASPGEKVMVPGVVRSAERIEPETSTGDREPEDPDPEIEDVFDPLRHDGAYAIELGIQQLENEAANSDDISGNSCRLALGAYDYLTETIRLDIRDVFQRWRQVPVIFMPAHVSNRYGASDRGSLPHLVDDAVRAYVFGAPAAAFAMCRAAFEMILKRHYGEGEWEDPKEKLAKVLALANERGLIKREEIRPLIDRADGILHRYAQEAALSPEDERTILIFLATLKSLIEQAPKRP